MKRKDSEAGSLHAVIIGVLFVSLMAALGVVFYQNFIADKSKDVATDTPAQVESDVTTRVAFNSDIYALDHPKAWKSTTTKSDDQIDGASTTKFTNAASTVEVEFTVSGKDINDTCDSNDGLKVSDYDIDTVAVANLTDDPVHLVEAISDSLGGGYTYRIGLTPDGGGTHAVVGDSHCTVKDVGIASRAIIGINKLAKPTLVAKITFPKLQPKSDVAIKDMKQIKDMMNMDDYKAAVKILESARKE